MMADAVIFLAVVLFAVAPFAHSLLKGSLLLLPGLNGFLRIVIFAARALTDTRLAGISSPSTDAVELSALATLAVTVQLGGRVSGVLWRGGGSAHRMRADPLDDFHLGGGRRRVR